ncbi:patatin-like phospholipase family protein [Capilliphycus salinus ALCB114379]|uniref:patatin-like phospholipase family protein n=1 Tax=Capilliphycus salinus TaxID=2768948 RepID=UPI0039A594FA
MFERSRRILYFDGSGIRGLLTATMLEEVEDKLKAINPDKELRDYFDIIAGTSSGSIIALAVAQGISALEIRSFFKGDGNRIFPDPKSTLFSLIQRFLEQDVDWTTFNPFNVLDVDNANIKKMMSQPVYDDKGLEEVLRENFSEQLFGELKPLVIIPSYDVYNRRATVFKNKDDLYKSLPVWEVCKASCSAPVAFPAHLINNDNFIYGLKKQAEQAKKFGKKSNLKIPNEGLPFIDGGLVANNPVLCAIAECRKVFKRFPSLVVSFGVGAGLHRITIRQSQGWGALNWASLIRNIPLMDVFTDGSSDATDYIVEQLLEQENDYVRFQPFLKEDVSTFSANEKNMIALEEAADDYMKTKEYRDKVQKVVEELT